MSSSRSAFAPRRRGIRSARGWLPALLVAWGLAGCAERGGRPALPTPSGDESAAESRALMLLIADRRQFDNFSVRRILQEAPALRSELALTVGRIGDPRGQYLLASLLHDPEPEVRRAAAFAYGLMPAEVGREPLLTALADSDRVTGQRAADSLGRLGAPLAEMLAAVETLSDAEAQARLLPGLFRFPAEEIVPVARWGLGSADPELRRWASYALARKATAAALTELRTLLASPDPWLRGWGARALGSVGDGGDAGALSKLAGGAEVGPAIQSLRAMAALVAAGRAAPGPEWRRLGRELLDHPHAGVRLTALETAGRWLDEGAMARALAERARSGPTAERRLALLALATGGDERAKELVEGFAREADPSLRAAAATAAGRLGTEEILRRLEEDASSQVRLAVLDARLASGAGTEAEVGPAAVEARRALLDPDEAVRAGALGWLAEHPLAPVEELVVASEGSERYEADLKVAAIGAVAARALAEGRERGAGVAWIELLARHQDYLVRRNAAEALGRLGRARPPVGPVETRRALASYRDVVVRTEAPGRVEIETRHGVLGIRLRCATARLTCLNFLQLVEQGFYDGLPFHRVVPDFVVQSGDPRGDGWGGPGYSLRDEFDWTPYERGTVGMARSGPDSAGSQFFIALSRQPHLDGAYAAFGIVDSGAEVLEAIVEGDRIRQARVVPAPAAAPARDRLAARSGGSGEGGS